MLSEPAMGTMLPPYLDDHWQLHKLLAIATDLVVHAIKKALAPRTHATPERYPLPIPLLLFSSSLSPVSYTRGQLALAFTANGIGLAYVTE